MRTSSVSSPWISWNALNGESVMPKSLNIVMVNLSENRSKFSAKFATKYFIQSVIGAYYYDSLLINEEPKLSEKERKSMLACVLSCF